MDNIGYFLNKDKFFTNSHNNVRQRLNKRSFFKSFVSILLTQNIVRIAFLYCLIFIVCAFVMFNKLLFLVASDAGQDGFIGKVSVENSSAIRSISKINYSPQIIEDVNGDVLAINRPVFTLVIDREDIWDEKIAEIILNNLLSKNGFSFSLYSNKQRWIEYNQKINENIKDQLINSGLAGLHFKKSLQRFYPHGSIFSHAIGLRQTGKGGVSGLEFISTKNQKKGGDYLNETFRTSLNLAVQKRVYKYLNNYKNYYNAESAWALIMNASTGAIVSMVSLPDYDNNKPTKYTMDSRRNRIFSDVYELGSVFKVFTLAMYLQTFGHSIDDKILVQKPLKIKDHIIKDHVKHSKSMSVKEVIARSSNLGAAIMGLQIPKQRFYDFYKHFGLLQRLDTSFLEKRSPIFDKKMTKLQRATMSFGHSIAVSPLQYLSVFASMVNGGRKVIPNFQIGQASKGELVISKETSQQIKKVLRSVVTNGTGKAANINGYDIIGKTGTAEKIINGEYSEELNLLSFVSAFPGKNPKYVMLVSINSSPQTLKKITTANSVVPLTHDILQEIMPILQIYPSDKNIKKY